jgi:pantetheine-phosphate adenylyltransferase
MARIGIYAGSFDPLTNGHVDMLRGAAGLVDTLVVAIGVHPSKAPVFSPEERMQMIEAVAGPMMAAVGGKLVVRTFSGLLVDLAREVGAGLLIRGLRDGTDLDYEMQLVGMNQAMAPQVQTVFLPSTANTRHITATLVRQIAQMKGDVSPFVPPAVLEALTRRFA